VVQKNESVVSLKPAEWTNIFHEEQWVNYLDWDKPKIYEFVENFM